MNIGSGRRRGAGGAAAIVTAAVAVLFAAGGSASAQGNPNAGDVWTDNVGQPAGAGHSQDPHLACTNINIWGNGLADSGGAYTVDGWPPSGSHEVDYSSTWAYSTASGGDQVISVINVQQLIKTAVASGDKPINSQGYHFKLDVTQDPQKHKTFWVVCAANPSPTPTPTSRATPTPTPTPRATPTPHPTPSDKPTPTPTPRATPTPTPTPSATPTPTPSQSVGGVLGTTTTTPATGAAIPAGPAAALIAFGGVLTLIARRRGREDH
jgi:hypothetical protein